MDEKKKGFWAIVWMVLVGVGGFFLYVFFNKQPKSSKVDNFVVKDDSTITTSQGVDVALPPEVKPDEIISAQTKVEEAPVAEDKISVVVKEATPTPVPPTEEKSAGELLFGPRKGVL